MRKIEHFKRNDGKMKNRKAFRFLSIILIVICITMGLAGCNFRNNSSARLEFLADSLALALMGDDAFNWNVFFVDPEQAYGVKLDEDAQWYSYSALSEDDLSGMCEALNVYKRYMSLISTSDLSKKEMITYRSLNDTLTIYLSYYGSPNALAFTLIGASYITSEGGYVADFASMVENYSLRSESDVKRLLSVVVSTQSAFASYLDYAAARVNAGFPLYDHTLSAMQNYLKGIIDLGDNYYLFSFIEHKIDNASFLTAAAKEEYKQSFLSALSNHFMTGVETLYEGLDAYKGQVVQTEQSYLAAYGQIGREYYEWCFENKTGIRNANLNDVYNSLVEAYKTYYHSMQNVLDEVGGLESTNKAVYDEFYEYLNGEKVYLDLTDPDDIIDYLKEAATSIVPALSTVPQINFKYLDSTVEQISSALAYYLLSPVDDSNSPENITLNGYRLAQNPSDTLTTIAHEGYPGHLYAHVREKELGVKLITTLNSSTAFSEGWAMYVELAVLNHIKNNTDNKALQLYCDYDSYNILAGYLNSVILDMQVNYFGNNVDHYINLGESEEQAAAIVETFMEIPSLYIPYGYGVYYMVELHDLAKDRLGDAYNEVEFNGVLLSEGFGPTLARARELTVEYIVSKHDTPDNG